MSKKIANPSITAVFDEIPKSVRTRLLELRELILNVAAETEGVGELEETLKWGQPSYLTSQTGSGTTIRIDQVKSCPDQYAMYVHCQTTLIDSFREMYGDLFRYEGNRSIIFNVHEELLVDALSHCIAMALTYHMDKNIRPTVNLTSR